MKNVITNYGRSVRAKLLNLSKEMVFTSRLCSRDIFRNGFFNPAYQTIAVMSIRWKAFVKKIKLVNAPTFNEVVAYLQDKLRPYWDNLNDANR